MTTLPDRRSMASLAACLALTAAAPIALADGAGVLLQKLGGRLVVGFDDDTPDGRSIGQRVFTDLLPPTRLTQDPSFLSVTPPPAGYESLPVGASVFWDFLPMTNGGATANLLHWNGVGEAAFAPAVGATLSLYDANFTAATVDGSAAAVPGRRIGATTASMLSLHAHRFWELGESAPPGVYIGSLRLRLDGLMPTPPIYVALATSGTPISALVASAEWLEARVDSLLLRGDYNFNGVVDASDYGVWSQQFGAATPMPVTQGEADGNGDGVIDLADYTLWRDAATAPAVTAVPEPAALCAAVLLGALAAGSPGVGLTRPRRRRDSAPIWSPVTSGASRPRCPVSWPGRAGSDSSRL